MSDEAVEKLLVYWRDSNNPVLNAAAGQLRQALNARPVGLLTCEACGRTGTKAFIPALGGGWVCAHEPACDKRAVSATAA